MMGVLFAQTVLQVTPTGGLELSASVVAAITAAAVAIIGALAAGIVSIIQAARISRDGARREEKLDRSERKLDNVTVLVDGRYSTVLQELANVKLLVATLTGTAANQLAARIAQVSADDQAAKVRSAQQADSGLNPPDVKKEQSL